MFKTKYEGELQQIGAGRWTGSQVLRRSLIRVGHQKLRNVYISDYLDSLLQSAIHSADKGVSLYVGRFIFMPWVLATKHNGELSREGLLIVIAGLLLHIICVLIVAGFAGYFLGQFVDSLGPAAIYMIIIYGIAAIAINIKTWLLPA